MFRIRMGLIRKYINTYGTSNANVLYLNTDSTHVNEAFNNKEQGLKAKLQSGKVKGSRCSTIIHPNSPYLNA